MVISFLEEHGSIPNDLRKRIYREENMDTLKRWAQGAARVSSVDSFMEKYIE